ncbi:MAG: hypothetical protein ACYCX8_03810, partial [Acidimicrobiales bacterium]
MREGWPHVAPTVPDNRRWRLAPADAGATRSILSHRQGTATRPAVRASSAGDHLVPAVWWAGVVGFLEPASGELDGPGPPGVAAGR